MMNKLLEYYNGPCYNCSKVSLSILSRVRRILSSHSFSLFSLLPMESQSILPLSTSPILLQRPKSKKLVFALLNPFCKTISLQIHSSLCKQTNHLCRIETQNPTSLRNSQFNGLFLKSHLSLISTGVLFPHSCFASEASAVANEVPSKINLEAIVVSIDEFFNKYPFFVAGVTFVWLVVIPLTEYYFSKYKSLSAFNAFKMLRDDPNCQLLDIREKRSLASLKSPNLKLLNKNVIQVSFREGDEDVFVKQVTHHFEDPGNTALCILDNFDGNSMKVAELLVKKGFKEAYAIKGGIKGKKGWQEIQEKLLPPSVHIKAKEKVKIDSKRQDADNDPVASVEASGRTEGIINGSLTTTIDLPSQAKQGHRSLSPYPNYPDLKPPASPTPSKPKG